MSALGGFIGGLLGLTLLDVVLQDSGAVGHFGGLLNGAAGLINDWIDPTKPLIKNYSGWQPTPTNADGTPLVEPGGVGSTGPFLHIPVLGIGIHLPANPIPLP